MTTIRLKYVHAYTDITGKPRYYFRKAGLRKVALPGLPGSPEFMAAYQTAVAGAPARDAPKPITRPTGGTINDLVAAYYQSAAYRSLRPITQADYRGIIGRLAAEHGDKSVAGIEKRHVEALVAAKAATPASANHFLRLLRSLFQLAIGQGIRDDNPAEKVAALTTRQSSGFHTWDEDELLQFEARWPVGTRERLAYSLHLYTGQRRADIVRMTWRDLRDGFIHVKQQKTGAALKIAIHPALTNVLNAAPQSHISILTTSQGATFTAAGYGVWFRAAVRSAGLSFICSSHGLRKAAARRLAEAGCSTHEIASITGHKTLAEIERYTKAASQAQLSSAAMAKLISQSA